MGCVEGRAVDHRLRPPQLLQQGQGHVAAVGDDRAEVQHPPPGIVPVVEQQLRQADLQGIHHRHHPQGDEEAPEEGGFKGLLKGLEHHAGGHDAEHQVREALHATLRQHLHLAAEKAHRHDDEQDQHLGADESQAFQHFSPSLPPADPARVFYHIPGIEKRVMCSAAVDGE